MTLLSVAVLMSALTVPPLVRSTPVSSAHGAPAAPRAEIPDSVASLGEIIAGDSLVCTFRLRNAGSAPLLVRSLHPG